MGDVVKNATAMKILGIILIFFSIAELAIGGTVFGFFTNVRQGSWWTGFGPFVAGICGYRSTDLLTVKTGIVFSILGLMVAIIGCVLDSINRANWTDKKNCWSIKAGRYIGSYDDTVLNKVDYCIDYYEHESYGRVINPYECICSDGEECFVYNLGIVTTCGIILNKYPALLATSTALCGILALTCLVYCIFACMTYCGCSCICTCGSAELENVNPVLQVEMVESGGFKGVPSAPAHSSQQAVQTVAYARVEEI